jgi:hypothetical protein
MMKTKYIDPLVDVEYIGHLLRYKWLRFADIITCPGVVSWKWEKLSSKFASLITCWTILFYS